MFTKTKEFEELLPEIQGLLIDHIMQEHDNNPATGSAGALMGGGGPPPPGGGGEVPQLPPGMAPPGGEIAPLNPGAAQVQDQPQAQVADLQATDFSNRRNK